MKSISLEVGGMSCDHCVKAVENALRDIDVSGKVDLTNNRVKIGFNENKVSLAAIRKAIEDQGYEVR